MRCQAFSDHSAWLSGLVQEIDSCRSKNYGSICLITKTEASAQSLYSELKARTDVHQLRLQNEDLQGTLIVPVALTKGLEFDAVILADADANTYHDDADRNLLYITATRALHRLSIFCEGTLSPLIPIHSQASLCYTDRK